MKKLFFLFFPLLIFAQNDLIINYLNLKKEYYQNQMLNLKLKIVSPTDKLQIINLDNLDINISKPNPYIYLLNVKFQDTNQSHEIMLYAKDINKTINFNNIIKTVPIPKINHFCHVLADDLNITNPISSKYNNNQILLSFSIKCKKCNLKDFHLNNNEKLNLNSFNEASYYIILPKEQKELDFYYLNTKNGNFQKIKIPIILKENTISTQTNINPNNYNFFTPINILYLVLIAFGLIVFLIYQKIWLLILPIIFSIPLIIPFLPKGEILLKKGDKITILPTFNSTVIYVVKKPQKVKILKKSRNYVEIKINNKTGWVNENN